MTIDIRFFILMAAAGFSGSTTGCLHQPEDRTPYRMNMPEVAVLDDGWDLIDSESHPHVKTRQSFGWGPYGTEWSVTMPPGVYAHAAFKVRHAHAFAARYQDLVMVFRLKPKKKAHQFTLAIMDDEAPYVWLATKTSLKEYQVFERDEWAYFRIPLSDFNLKARHEKDRLYPPVKGTPDWKNISEVRLIRIDDTPKYSSATLRNIRVRARDIPSFYDVRR